MYTLLCVDGNGESQVAAMSLVQREDESSIRNMMELFKKNNPSQTSVEVVMTDKGMLERKISQEELP